MSFIYSILFNNIALKFLKITSKSNYNKELWKCTLADSNMQLQSSLSHLTISLNLIYCFSNQSFFLLSDSEVIFRIFKAVFNIK